MTSRRGESQVAVAGSAAGLPPRVVRDAVTHVLRGERRKAEVAVVFVGRQAMRRINAAWLHHDWPTDVVTFPLERRGAGSAGDIYICRQVAARHAREHHVPVRQELLRLIVHGTLHLLGWDHPESDARARSPMWRRQERYVTELT
ncbi:MAG: rRNA maturation RNase YbeY [Gemmatimonadales bacterium]